MVAIFLSAAPLGAIFSFSQNAKNNDVAYAATGCTNTPLSGNFATDITNNEACIVSVLPDLGDTDGVLTELTQVMYGSAVTDPIQNNVPKLAQMVMDGVKGGSVSGTLNKLGSDTDWTNTYTSIHQGLLTMISAASTEWSGHAQTDDNAFLGKFFNDYQSTDSGSMSADVTDVINNNINGQLLPYAALIFASLQTLIALHANPAVQNDLIAGGMSQATFDEEASDYDKGNKGDSGTTTYIFSFPTFAADMQSAANSTNSGSSGDSSDSSTSTNNTFPDCTAPIMFSCAEKTNPQYVYQATVTWYADVASMSNVFFNNQAVKDTASLATIKTAMVTAASAMSSGGNADGTNGAFNRCGNIDTSVVGIPDIGQAMAAALCQFVVLVQGFSISLLTSSLDVLGRIAGIKGLQSSVGVDSGLAAQLIPKELTADFLSNALNGQQLCSSSGAGCAGSATTMACTSGSTDPSCTFHAVLVLAHSIILRAVNVLLILIFLVLALATMLQIQVNNYSVQKLLAPVLIGFLLAQFSFFAIRVMVEASTYAANTVVHLTPTAGGGGNADATGPGVFLTLTSKLGSVKGDPNVHLTHVTSAKEYPDLPLIFQQGVLNLFIIAAAVIVFILAFMFALRAIIIAFLTPLSALAFFALPIPPLKSMWGTWWKNFSSWLVMPIIACFWLWLAFTWLISVNYGAQASSVQSIIGYLFAMVCFMAAMRTSTKVAGETKMVMDQWKGMGSKMWAATGGKGIKAAKAEGINAGKLLIGKTGAANSYRDYKAFQKRRQDRVDSVWKTGVDPKDAEKRAHALTHANEQKAEKEAKLEKLISEKNPKNQKAIDSLQHEIEHLQHEIDHIDDGFLANGGLSNIKNIRHALQSRKNKAMMERLGNNIKRSQKDALEHKSLAEVESVAGLRLSDYDHEYQERDALMRESVDRSDMAKERVARVDKQNYEGMSAIKYQKDAAGNDILDAHNNPIPIKDERTGNVAGRTTKQINLGRLRTGLREKKLSEKYTADKLESDRIKQEARGNLLLVDENPDKDEDYQRYQEVERWLDAARDEQKAKSTTALPEAFSKPFHTSKAHSYTDHTGAHKESSAHTRILSGPLVLTEEERNSEAKMKSLIEASGHLQGMVEMMGQNKPETIRYAANRIMQLTPPDRVDQALVNMTVYGDPAAIQAMVGADAAKLQAAKDAGLIDNSVANAAAINNQTTNFDDVNYRRLRSAFGKSTVSQRIDKITGDRADIVKGTNYTKQADGSFKEKSYT